VIWVEILSRHREVIVRHRCDGDVARVGRAYDNDVVVDDPYVAPHHLRIARGDDGRLVAEDLGSANGLFEADGSSPVARTAIDGDRPVRIGRTLLRVRDGTYAVPAERIAARPARLWPATVALIAVLVAMSLVSLWLNETGETRVAHYVLALLSVTVLVLVWTSAWAIFARIFGGVAGFERHLVIALAGLLAWYLYDIAIEYVAFALSWAALVRYAFAGAWLLLAGVCFFHLRAIAPGRWRLKAAVVGTLAMTAIGTQALAQAEIRNWMPGQSSLRDLKPPVFRLAAPEDEAAFFEGAQRLQSKLDRARTEEPVRPGALSAFDFDD
jgi:hypothetical protein